MTSSLNPFPHPLNGDISFTQKVFEYILNTARGWEYKDKQLENGGQLGLLGGGGDL